MPAPQSTPAGLCKCLSQALLSHSPILYGRKFAEGFVQLISANEADEAKVLLHVYSGQKEGHSSMETVSLQTCIW